MPKAPSVALHERMAFKLVGVYRAVGYKLERWHDVGWWHLVLQEHHRSPSLPRDVKYMILTREWEEAMTQG